MSNIICVTYVSRLRVDLFEKWYIVAGPIAALKLRRLVGPDNQAGDLLDDPERVCCKRLADFKFIVIDNHILVSRKTVYS
jgi:hypothetical protein